MGSYKKEQFAKDVVELATVVSTLYTEIDQLLTVQRASGYAQEGADKFVDADFPDGDRDLGHLTATEFYAALSALSSIKTQLEESNDKGRRDLANAAVGTLRQRR